MNYKVIGQRTSAMPRWAILERDYLRLCSSAPEMLKDYLTPEGKIFWPEIEGFHGFGGVDNVFEGFQSFPLLYLLGGDDSLLEYSRHEYRTLTEQFNEIPNPNASPELKAMGRGNMLVDGLLPEYDWMHIGENNMFLYYLLLADPSNEMAREHVLAQSQIQFEEHPAGLPRCYDPEKKVFASANLGANGPKLGGLSKPYRYASWLDFYGLPYYDIPGVNTLLDLKDPEKAERYGKIYGERRTGADTPTNMLSTSLAVNAYMVSGEEKYRDFVLDYVGAWREREVGQELMPDNAGPNGIVGETMNGKFYGGHYGWTHPHGYFFIEDALVVGGENERLFTGRKDSLDWARRLFTTLVGKYGIPAKDGGMIFPHKRADEGSILEYVGKLEDPMTAPATYTDEPGYVKYLQKDGWYEFRPATSACHWGHIYSSSLEESDADWMEKILPPTQLSVSMKNVSAKYKGGQHGAYVRYLTGRYPEYPEAVMQHSIDLFYHQATELAKEKAGATKGFGYRPSSQTEWDQLRAASEIMRETTGITFDDTVIHSYYQTYLLYRTPLSAEGLVNLTMGGQVPVYNGGLLHTQLRYFDADRKRPGLPEGVAALVSSITEEGVTLVLVNTDPVHDHSMVIQGGAYGEHNFASYMVDGETVEVGGKWAEVRLIAGSIAELTIRMDRFANQPSLEEPFERE